MSKQTGPHDPGKRALQLRTVCVVLREHAQKQSSAVVFKRTRNCSHEKCDRKSTG